jgi:hypothetical protein
MDCSRLAFAASGQDGAKRETRAVLFGEFSRWSARLRSYDGRDLFKKSRVLFPGYSVDAHLRSPGIIGTAVINRLPGFHCGR